MNTRFHIFALLSLQMLCFTMKGQSQVAHEYMPMFSAIIVSDIDKSTKWYQSLFELREKTKMNDPSGNYKVVILFSEIIELELLELKGSSPRKNILNDKSEAIQVQGLFKIGFSVKNMDTWLIHLKSLNIDVPQIWKDEKTGKRNFLIADPDGNLIQFFE